MTGNAMTPCSCTQSGCGTKMLLCVARVPAISSVSTTVEALLAAARCDKHQRHGDVKGEKALGQLAALQAKAERIEKARAEAEADKAKAQAVRETQVAADARRQAERTVDRRLPPAMRLAKIEAAVKSAVAVERLRVAAPVRNAPVTATPVAKPASRPAPVVAKPVESKVAITQQCVVVAKSLDARREQKEIERSRSLQLPGEAKAGRRVFDPRRTSGRATTTATMADAMAG